MQAKRFCQWFIVAALIAACSGTDGPAQKGIGEPCLSPDDCDSKLCVAASNTQYCTATCVLGMPGCPAPMACTDVSGSQICVMPGCVPDCGGKVCGDDGCGGSCGVCSTGTCLEGACTTQCVSHDHTVCVGTDEVFWADSCDAQEELRHTCAGPFDCVDDGCSLALCQCHCQCETCSFDVTASGENMSCDTACSNGCNVSGCGSSEQASGGCATGPLTVACDKLEEFCPTGYGWSTIGATDAVTCKEKLDCVMGVYADEGACRYQLVDGIACLAAVTSSSGCAACNDLFSQMTTGCPPPIACM